MDMNENPYAPPEEVAERPREEEKYIHGLRRLAWGVAWILWGSILVIGLFFIGISRQYDVLPPSFYYIIYEWYAVLIVIPIMMLIGVFFCCFCPRRLVKWGKIHVIVSVGMLIGSMMIPNLCDFSYTWANILLAGLTTSVLLWLFFLLRLAAALQSTAGKWLAWCGMIIYGILMAGTIAYVNLYAWHEFWWEMWAAVMSLLCVVVYPLMLNTLRRRIRRVIAEMEGEVWI